MHLRPVSMGPASDHDSWDVSAIQRDELGISSVVVKEELKRDETSVQQKPARHTLSLPPLLDSASV